MYLSFKKKNEVKRRTEERLGFERPSDNPALETVECQHLDELVSAYNKRRTLFWKSHAYEGDADFNTQALRYTIAIYAAPEASPEG